MQQLENARRKDIPSHHGQIGRRFFGFRFFNNALDALVILPIRNFHDAVRAGLLRGDGFHAQHAAAGLVIGFNHLRQRTFGRVNQIVRQHHGKRFAAHGRLRAQHGMPQTQSLRLADIQAGNMVRQDVLNVREQLVFVAQRQFGFQFVGFIEMVFDAAFAAAGHKNDFGAACFHGFFHCVLNQGLIDNRQHFFGIGLGGGQKTRAHAGNGEYGFADFRVAHNVPLLFHRVDSAVL